MKYFIFSILSILFLATNVDATINKISNIEEIKNEVKPGDLVFFNIAEVLLDTETSLGTQAWRKFVRSRVDSKLHDELTWFVFNNVPPKAPEKNLPALIDDLQCGGYFVMAFTSRGRHEWYGSQIPQVDLVTEKMLNRIGIDFSRTDFFSKLLSEKYADFYHNGVIYATNGKDKAEVLTEILELTGYVPPKIVFVDDKMDSLVEIEEALGKLNIPFVGYAYNRTAKDHANFDPMIANIQLDWLIMIRKVFSDEDAQKIKKANYLNPDPEQYFKQILTKWPIVTMQNQDFILKLHGRHDGAVST